MNWTFKNIIPHTFSEKNIINSNVWNKEFTLAPNQNYQITSPSGKGKSTFTAFCYGLRNDFKGNILLNKESINTISSEKWANLRAKSIAIVPQQLQLFPNLTILENLLLKNNLTHHKTHASILSFIQALDIEECKDKKAKNTSFGQQQRAAIIRALLQPFSTLIMDEPFSHLDKDNMAIAQELISKETRLQNANLIVTSLHEKPLLFNATPIHL